MRNGSSQYLIICILNLEFFVLYHWSEILNHDHLVLHTLKQDFALLEGNNLTLHILFRSKIIVIIRLIRASYLKIFVLQQCCLFQIIIFDC